MLQDVTAPRLVDQFAYLSQRHDRQVRISPDLWSLMTAVALIEGEVVIKTQTGKKSFSRDFRDSHVGL